MSERNTVVYFGAGMLIFACLIALVFWADRRADTLSVEEEAGGRFGAVVTNKEARAAVRDHEERLELLEEEVQRLKALQGAR